ncbi:MAG: DUF1553 domain-containing protein [Planctomycetes bacterium]|nr:DUF1553 domain-containing protein [Planctomycetota bacterium]
MNTRPFVRIVAALLTALLTSTFAAQAQHWADRPIVRPEPPTITGDSTATPLDRFVRATLQQHQLQPTLSTDRGTWLRRVALDLTGIPPTPDEVDAFVADTTAGAAERQVDRLLASPRFAERWTQWWLDLARYTDSQGYEKDALRRTMWRYRDWVLDAFASDMPLDRFTELQLAGDLLPDATDEDRLATAFHRQTMTNTEGGTDDEEFRVAAVIDRVDTTMSVWMGATAGCAQCHDHKFDPISQKEFYELFAFFDQTADNDQGDDAPLLRVPTRAQREQQAQYVDRDATFANAAVQRGVWQLLGPIAAKDFATAHRTPFAPETDGVRLDAEQQGQRWREMPDYADGAVHNWQGGNSAFYLYRTLTADAATSATLALGSDDAIAVWWNGEEVLRHEIGRPAAPDQELVPVQLRAGENTLLLKVTNGGGPGGFYFQLQPPSYAVTAEGAPAVPVMQELPADQRRTTRIHRRGNFLDQGDAVTANTPAVWPALPADTPRNRLGLARWLMSPDNPRTARVFANRIWSELFGQGLVTTLEDFGSQGEPPSHPALLDWLACELRDSGWSLRHLLRTIVLSQTYAMSSVTSPEARELDPDNRWLSRGAAFRLSGETLRDQALFVSGLLHERLGGPSVMPPQPDGIWMQIYSGARWVEAEGDDRHRRSLYTFWRRTSPHPQLLIFDAMSREACVLRRQRTNTPLQALVLWNDPQFFEAAQGLASLAMFAEPEGDDEARVAWLWRRCLLRSPTATEAARLVALLRDERQRFFADPEATRKFATGREGLAEEAAAWTVVASVVLGLDEFVTRR